MATFAQVSAPGKNVTYRYVALNSQDKLVKGTIKAASEPLAGHLLAEKGLRPVSLELQASMLSPEQMLPSLFHVKPQEVNSFSRQLAILIDAGITLLPAIESIQQLSSRAFKRVLTAVINDLRTGISFSEALSRHPKVFNEVYCKTLAAAERTGGLGTILRQMADYQKKQSVTKKKVSRALVYPAIILILGTIVGAVLITTALPPLVDLFVNMEVSLPLPTRILIGVHSIITDYKLYLLGAVVLLIVSGIWLIKQPAARQRLDRLLLRIPLIGPPTHSSEIARFTRTTSVLLSAGLPLHEVIGSVSQTSGNRAMRRSLSRLNEELIQGDGISGPMSRDNIFPPLLYQMVMVGEESNTLASTLGLISDFYESNAEEQMNTLTGVIQPASTIFIALMVGFLALSVLMPMYSITGAFD